MTTIKTALLEAVNLLKITFDSAQLDAEILLCKVLDKERSYLRTWQERVLTQEETAAFDNLIQQRQQGQPIAYLTGVKEFWSREFMVTPDVLIPRPETELLIELALSLIPADKPCKIIDLGTGSGIIAITLAAERPNAEVIATDTSVAALDVAKQNAKKHQVNNIQFYQSCWFDNIPAGNFDLIISNPPYVAEGDPHLQQGDLRFEPISALTSGSDGLADIREIAMNAYNRLNPEGYLLLEHGYNQKDDTQTLLRTFEFCKIQTYNDLAGHPRMTTGQYLPLS